MHENLKYERTDVHGIRKPKKLTKFVERVCTIIYVTLTRIVRLRKSRNVKSGRHVEAHSKTYVLLWLRNDFCYA